VTTAEKTDLINMERSIAALRALSDASEEKLRHALAQNDFFGNRTSASMIDMLFLLASSDASEEMLRPALKQKKLCEPSWPAYQGCTKYVGQRVASLKTTQYAWSSWTCRIGHLVPIWQPFIGSSFQ
jgi:hypothetical protein